MRQFKIAALGILAVGILVAAAMLIGVEKIEGNEAAVRQHWKKGVVNQVWRDGTHFYWGWFWDIYKYNIGTQKMTFDLQNTNKDAEYSCILVNVGENGGQAACISVSVNYRVGWDGTTFNPDKLVALHKDGLGGKAETYKTVVLKRTVVDVVNQVARPRTALEIYSGKGFVEFKEAIDQTLREHPVFKQRGIYII